MVGYHWREALGWSQFRRVLALLFLWLVATVVSRGTAVREGPSCEGYCRGETASKVAWEIWEAGRLENHGLRDRIVALALDPAGESDRERRCVQLVALDALIIMGARVPVAALGELYDEFPAQVLTLACRDESANRAFLLDLLTWEEDSVRWRAAANALVQAMDEEIAERLLGSLRLTIELEVIGEVRPRIEMGGSVGGPTGGKAGSELSGFPPIARYSLTAGPAPSGAILVSDGPTPIHAVRRTGLGALSRGAVTGRAVNRDQYRLGLLARMAETPLVPFEVAPWGRRFQDPDELIAHRRIVHRWIDAEGFCQMADEIVAATVADYQKLLVRLSQWPGLSSTENRARFPIRLRVFVRVRDDLPGTNEPIRFPERWQGFEQGKDWPWGGE